MDFDQLYALRIYYEDQYSDEIDIIKSIKFYLINNGINNNDANKLIKEFYDSFGIPINSNDLEKIQLFRNFNDNIINSLSFLTGIGLLVLELGLVLKRSSSSSSSLLSLSSFFESIFF